MLPDLSFLVALALGLILFTPPVSEAGPSTVFALGGTAAVLVTACALCRVAADRAIRALDETDAQTVVSSSGRIVVLPMLGWIAALWAFDWPRWVRAAIPESWFLVPYLVLFAPLFGLFAGGWIAARRVEARLSPDAPSRLGALLRGLRRNLLVLVPLTILLALMDLLRVLAEAGVPAAVALASLTEAYPDVRNAATIVVFAGFGLLAPTLFRVALRAKPLEDGPLRRDLAELARRIGLRLRDFLLWDTKGRAVNAMVVGLGGGTRYVFLTDGLVEALPRPEVVAVVAHEAGHGMRRHLPLYFVTAFALVLLLQAAEDAAPELLGGASEPIVVGAFLMVFWFGVLGWLSRRFEREADVYGAEHAGVLQPDAPALEVSGAAAPLPHGAALMISVLRRLDRAIPGGRYHRHAHPRERVAYLVAYAIDPAVRERHRRDGRGIRLGILALFLVSLVVTAARIPGALVRGEAATASIEGLREYDRAWDARARGDEAAALAAARAARERFERAEAGLPRRPDDLQMKWLAARAAFNEADIDLRWLGDERSAKARFERSLALADAIGDVVPGKLVFDAHVDLGRIALHEGGPDAVPAARRHLLAAESVPEPRYSGRLRGDRLRLLRYAIGLHSDDPKVAEQARRDLEVQAKYTLEGPEWEELRRDAQAELAAAPR